MGRIVASISLFLVGVLSLLLFDPITTAYIHNEPSAMWRFVNLFTHIVSHGSWSHLLGNYIFGAPFLIYLETKMKSTKKFVRLFFILGFASLALQSVFNYFSSFQSLGLIGSSGAIFGVVGAALMSYKGPRPIELAARSMLIFHVVNQAQMAFISLHFPMGIGFAAHLGGLLAGIAFSLRLHRRLYRRLRNWAK